MSTSPTISEPVWRGIDQIVPYWRNPRRVTEEAVNAVVESIKRYGYRQPIVVDEKNVIIIGHTRYSAMRRMKQSRVQVVVANGLTESQVKQLRIVDNRSGEFATWAIDELLDELKTLNRELMMGFFPEASVIGDFATPSAEEIAELEAATQASHQRFMDGLAEDTEFICPACFHDWVMNVEKRTVMARGVLTVDGLPAKEVRDGAA